MRRIRFSIAGLMFAVAMSAVLVAALRSGSPAWAGAMLMLSCGILGLAIVGAICRRGGERVWWVGFAVFGCGYLALAFWSEHNFENLPTVSAIFVIGSGYFPDGQLPGAWNPDGSMHWSFTQIVHCLWAILAAILGGALAGVLFAVPDDDRTQGIVQMDAGETLPPLWRRKPTVIWLAGTVLVALAALAGLRAAPGLWAGVVFLLTCGMLATAILGALVGRGGRRTMWLGAALFGCGYMVFTFGRFSDSGWPYTPTTHLLNALRPGSPPHWSGFPDASDRFNILNESVLKALEVPIPMHFPSETPLEDILKHIKSETEARIGKPIPIYVDPYGLQEAHQTMSSKVVIDVEGATVKNCLSRCLKQLDLTFSVRDGFLMITDAGTVLPVYEDPFLIVGHCFLALIAAAVGGVLAPLVSEREVGLQWIPGLEFENWRTKNMVISRHISSMGSSCPG